MDSGIDQLFTTQSLLTLQGATAATLLVPNIGVQLFDTAYTRKQRLWTALVIAMALSYLAAAVATGSWTKWIVAFFNGCLVFSASIGLNETAVQVGGDAARAPNRALGAGHARRNRSWLR
jgi:TRAP-type C4-dicarboxylate transport system permease small subunit